MVVEDTRHTPRDHSRWHPKRGATYCAGLIVHSANPKLVWPEGAEPNVVVVLHAGACRAGRRQALR